MVSKAFLSFDYLVPLLPPKCQVTPSGILDMFATLQLFAYVGAIEGGKEATPGNKLYLLLFNFYDTFYLPVTRGRGGIPLLYRGRD